MLVLKYTNDYFFFKLWFYFLLCLPVGIKKYVCANLFVCVVS